MCTRLNEDCTDTELIGARCSSTCAWVRVWVSVLGCVSKSTLCSVHKHSFTAEMFFFSGFAFFKDMHFFWGHPYFVDCSFFEDIHILWIAVFLKICSFLWICSFFFAAVQTRGTWLYFFFFKFFFGPRFILWSHWLLLFWTLRVLPHGFQIQSGYLTCTLSCLHAVILKVTSGATPAFSTNRGVHCISVYTAWLARLLSHSSGFTL